VTARRLGIDGDQVGSPQFHGGVDQAVYAFAREDLDHWGRELGTELPDGQFGENLTTVGIDVNASLVGERWRIGGALFEVASVRIPCSTFQRWMGASGHDSAQWVKRFTMAGRPGPYLRVLEEGEIEAGQPIEVVYRPDHDITVSFMFRALTREKHLRPELLRVDGLAQEIRERIGSG
jgi:MOSC domain-containing protein YiiM